MPTMKNDTKQRRLRIITIMYISNDLYSLAIYFLSVIQQVVLIFTKNLSHVGIII